MGKLELKSWKAELYLFLVTFIWGGTFVFTKLGLEFCSPSLFVIIRYCVALILCIAFFNKSLLKIDKRTMKHGALLGLLFGGGFLLQTYGLKMTSVSKSSFITGITVALTPFAFYFVEKKTVKLWSILGVITCAVGLYIFTNPDFSNLNYGDVLTFISTAFWAYYITYMDVFTRGKSGKDFTAQIVAMQFAAALPLLIISFFIFDYNNFFFIPDSRLFLALGYNGILASFAVTFIHTAIQKYTTPVKASLIFSLEPIVATMAAVLFFSETMDLAGKIGAAILFAGVLVSEIGGALSKKYKEV